MIDERLAASIRIFTELGWDGAKLEDTPGLPLGSMAQQREALAGLRTGPWSEVVLVDERTLRGRSLVPVDADKLAIFAIRAGVDARRALELLRRPDRVSDSLQARVLAERGPSFAADFVRLACVATRRPWVHATSTHAGAAVRLVHELGLEVPASVEYLKDWAAFAAASLGRPSDVFPQREFIAAAVIRSRFVDHVRAAVAAGSPATASFGEAFPAGVSAGWIDRDEALALAISALDRAPRPGDRKVWIGILVDTLAVTDAELLTRADLLVAVLATGDAVVVETLAPRLLAQLHDDDLVDAATVALATTARKARVAVLNALVSRSLPPHQIVAALADQLATLAADRDRTTARAAERALVAWGATPEAAIPQARGRGVWRATPEVWEIPRLELPDATAENLAAAAGALMAKPESAHDIDSERFLALLVDLAGRDEKAARTALRGVRQHWAVGLRGIAAWLSGEAPGLLFREGAAADVITAREFAIVTRLGELPLMLSTPTWVDMRIAPEDLLERLQQYRDAGTEAAEADLQLAITRLDLTRISESHVAAFAALTVPVRIASGRQMPVTTVEPERIRAVWEPVRWEPLPGARLRRTAGQIVADYVVAPMREPALEIDRDGHWRAVEAAQSPALGDLPSRLARSSYERFYPPVVHPSWGDATAAGLEGYPEQHRGITMRQAARRATPFGPLGAVSLFGALRQLHPRAAEEAMSAVVEAFDRGLLRPGVANARLLDSRDIAALTSAALDLADDGLAAVVWLILDDLITVSLGGTRMLAGTSNLAEAMAELAPGALAAVNAGVVETAVLTVPGLHALAARGGSARAVVVARQAVALLPRPEISAPSAAARPDFENVWPPGAGDLAALDDGARLSAEWEDPAAPTKMLALDIRLTRHRGRVFRVLKGWTYDLEKEGQCRASTRSERGIQSASKHDVYLAWNGRRLEPYATREKSGGKGVLTTSMHAAVLTTMCHDGDRSITGEHLVRNLQANGLIGWRGIRVAILGLLPSSDVSPARMMRVIEKHPRTLPVLWPVIVESISFAANSDDPLPHWLNRVLDVALLSAPHLAEASRRGWIPEAAAGFPGLAEIAARSGSSAALKKARALLGAVS